MPAFVGRTGIRDPATGASIPRFLLRPDIPGQELEGGLIGWKQLLASNQSLSFAAGMGVNCFDKSNTLNPPPPPQDDIASPSSTTTSRFGWGSLSSRSNNGTPVTPSTPATSMSSISNYALPWEKDACTGSWNHRTGRDWWFHMERDRPGNSELIDVKQLF